MRIERWAGPWLALRVTLSGTLLIIAYILYMLPMSVCPASGDLWYFPCNPLHNRLHGLLYLGYAALTVWVFLVATSPTAPMKLLAACTGRISLFVFAFLLLAHGPDFVVEGSYPSWAIQTKRETLLLLSPLVLLIATKPLVRWAWLWRPDRDAFLTWGQRFRLAVLFPMLGVYLTQCMTVSDLNPALP